MIASTIGIVFPNEIPVRRRLQIEYAARCFAAARNLSWSNNPDVRLCYGRPAVEARDIPLTAHEPLDLAPLPARDLFLDAEADTYPQMHPGDWLADIFEWLAAPVENTTDDEDAIGAVPFSATLCGRFKLDPEVPWAAIAMRGLDHHIRLARPEWEPWIPEAKPLVATTHDLDFLPIQPMDAVRRWLKNIAIAVIVQRSPRLAFGIGCRFGRFSTVEDLAERETRLGVESSWYAIAARGHSRDANYWVADLRVRSQLDRLRDMGHEVGVHGSYDSVLGVGRLADEYERMRRMRFRVQGGRQHWLRYRPAELIEALTLAGARYDASVGFNDRVGFRAGVPFAYVPWSFREQRPAPFLELPMAMMDATLFHQDRHDGDAARRRADRTLRRVALYGPGGASIVWHNTGFNGLQLPGEIGQLYWELADPSWVAGRTVVNVLRPRFEAAGLLPPVEPDAIPLDEVGEFVRHRGT